MSLKPISAVYDHAVEQGYLADDGGLSFLDDIQEGYRKDGHTEHADLTAFVAAVAALPTQPGLIELGALLRKAAEAETTSSSSTLHLTRKG